MALQGDLQSFALPDVLRLLAGTGKSGRLGVTGDGATGDIWLRDGSLVGGTVSSAPHAEGSADVVFELMRFESGSFAFEDDQAPESPSEPTDVDDAIGQASDLLAEWNDVEAVVPSVHSWVSLAPEIDGDETTVSASQWRALAALGGGATVRDLGDLFEQTDLVASRQVKELVEAGLVELGEAPADRPAPAAPAPAAAPAVSEPAPVEPAVDELAVLRADDGPVVLETRDDALLPEPLPSEGTSFEGDLESSGTVDVRSETSAVAEASADHDPYERFDVEPEPALAAEVDPIASAFGEEEGTADDFFASAEPEPSSVLTEEVAADPLDSTLSTDDGAPVSDVAGVDDDSTDRGALLNFLSSVKN